MKRIAFWTAFVSLCVAAETWAQQPNQDSSEDERAIHGLGTTGTVPVFTGTVDIGDSELFQRSGLGYENSGIVLGIGTPHPDATLHLNFGGTANQDTVILGDCKIKCLVIGDPDHAHIQALGTNLVVTGDTVILDSAGQILAFNPRKVPEANFGIGVDVATNILTVKQNSVTDPIADAWTTYSSARWKTNIEPLDGALDKVEHLRGVSFDWKANGKHDIGLVAEEVAPVVPEVVSFEQNGKDAKSVDYGRIAALLIEAIKEQQKEIKELKAQIDKLAPPSVDKAVMTTSGTK